jgi:uncharacterized protein
MTSNPPEQAPGWHEPGPAVPDPARQGDERLAALSYLGVPILGPLVPLAIYLSRKRVSGYVRRHSAQALNLSITAFLYAICALILGGMLALDSLVVALIVAIPLVVALWVITLSYVLRAGSRARQGSDYQIPAWLCASILR